MEWLRYVSQSPSLYFFVDVPSMIKSPEVYLSKPPTIFNNVVLPHPEGPNIATNSDCLKLRDIPFKA